MCLFDVSLMDEEEVESSKKSSSNVNYNGIFFTAFKKMPGKLQD